MSLLRHAPGVVAIALVALSAAPVPAQAQGRLEARYSASLAGIPLGKGTWIIDLSGDQYAASASGKTTGLMQVFAGGQGAVEAKGTVNNGKPVTATYASNVVSDKKLDQVRISVTGGTVKDYSAEPPPLPVPDRVPVTDAHRRGVVDPMSATLMAVAGNGSAVKPDACNRNLAIFDGRGRFDIGLSYKRMERVRSEQGYDGPVVVCAVKYRPVVRSSPQPARHPVSDGVARHRGGARADRRYPYPHSLPGLDPDRARHGRAGGDPLRCVVRARAP